VRRVPSPTRGHCRQARASKQKACYGHGGSRRALCGAGVYRRLGRRGSSRGATVGTDGTAAEETVTEVQFTYTGDVNNLLARLTSYQFLDLDIEEQVLVELGVDDERISNLLSRHEELVAREVRAARFESLADGYRQRWEVEGVEMEIAIEPLSEATA